jgi:hypothetical protein
VPLFFGTLVDQVGASAPRMVCHRGIVASGAAKDQQSASRGGRCQSPRGMLDGCSSALRIRF